MRKRFYALCLMAALLSFLPGHASAESETAAPAAESAAVAAVEQTTPAVAKADVPQRAAPAKPPEKADAALPAQSEATSKAAAEEAPAASNAAAAPETPGPVAAADTEDTPVEEAPEEEKDAAIPDVTPPAEEAEAEGDEVQAATDDEADAIEAEPEKEAAADAAEITDGEKQEPADSAADTARDPEDGPAADSEAVADVLEAGTELDAEALARAPKALGAAAQAEEADAVVEVHSFDELKAAIQNAGSKKTVIKVMESFELTEKLTIAKDQNILLTADNEQTAEKLWKPIEQPADSNDAGEEKQRESIDAGRNRGEEALEKADTPLPSEEEGAIILKRAKEFVEDTLFAIFGTLTWGDEDSAIHIDGNEEVETEFDDRGAIATVENGGSLTLKNGTVMHANNKHGYTAPIKVKKGGTFTMEGGRISHNKSYERIDPDYNRPTSSGAVYVDPGSTFHMTGGMIDNNDGGMSGGVFAGSLFGSTGDPARVIIDGGIIANNRSNTRYQSGGGITIYPKAELHMNDGIVAGNKSGSGGGIAVSDQFLSEFSNIINREYANTPADYEKHLEENKSEAFIDGGLIYKNKASAVGGLVYVDTNFVHFGKTMILDNKSGNFGGGVYISFPPRIQTLKNLLITENTAIATWIDSFGGDGGGLWNCPTGYVHIGDKHTVYVFDNEAKGRGKDIGFSEKTKYFLLNKENIQDKFYSHILRIR